MNEALPPSEGNVDPEPERQTTPFLVLQFFVFPMAIVAVCVAVFVVFGLIAAEGKGAREYLSEVRTGSANRRWQAAFELSKLIYAKKDPALSDPRFVSEAIALFQESSKDDPRVRRYLALTLGRLADPRAVPALLEALEGDSPDSETQIYSAWALGSIADPRAVPGLGKLAASEDGGVRKAAVHALGVFSTPDAAAVLLKALEDASEDVRWNAAVALGRHGETRASLVLLQMMDRAHLAQVPGVTPEQQDEAILEAVAASERLSDPALTSILETLADKDQSPRVRQAAQAALQHKNP